MLESGFAFEDQMALFWHGHFATQASELGRARGNLAWQQIEKFYEYGRGNFRELLHAMVRDAALLRFLDNTTNVANAPNENFARELLELFTLGEGWFSEADVVAATRAFTGWRHDKQGNFRYVPRRHDGGEKTFIGVTGNLNGDDIVEIILEQPRCTEHIAESLWRHFVSAEIDPATSRSWSRKLRAANYEMAALLEPLQTLLEKRRAAGHRRIKSPAELVLGSYAQFQLPVTNLRALHKTMAGMGFTLFQPPDVNGWPGHRAWIDSNTLMSREKFIRQLAKRITEMSELDAGNLLAFGLDVESYTRGFRDGMKGILSELDGWAPAMQAPAALRRRLDAISDESLRRLLTYLHSPGYQLV